MDGEREGRRMAGNTSFNSKKKKLNFMLLQPNTEHHTIQLSQKKQDITEKSNDLS